MSHLPLQAIDQKDEGIALLRVKRFLRLMQNANKPGNEPPNFFWWSFRKAGCNDERNKSNQSLRLVPIKQPLKFTFLVLHKGGYRVLCRRSNGGQHHTWRQTQQRAWSCPASVDGSGLGI